MVRRFVLYATALSTALVAAAAHADCASDADCESGQHCQDGKCASAPPADTMHSTVVSSLGLELSWTAPAECPDGQHMLRDIERLSGRSSTALPHRIVVSGSVARGDTGAWAVDLIITPLDDASHQRHVEGKSCREVADAAAVIVALSLDPTSAAEASARPPKVVRAPPPKPQTARAPAPPRNGLTVGGQLFGIGGADFAALPSPAAGLGVGGAVTFEKNRFELRAMAWIPETEVVSKSSGVDVSLYAAELRYCRVLVGEKIALSTCAGFEAGALHATAFGLRRNGSGWGRWLAPDLALVGEAHPVRHFAVSLEVEGLVPIVREHFLIDRDLTFRPAIADVRTLLGVGVEWR